MAIDPDHMEQIFEYIKCKDCEWFEPCPCGCGWGVCTDKHCDAYVEFVGDDSELCEIDVTYRGRRF